MTLCRSFNRILVRFVKQHRPLFVLTGAGCSTDSGIPDYRDQEGQWKHRTPVQYREFLHRHDVRQRYWGRSQIGWPQFAQARPNGAHYALAHLEQAGFIHQIVTQNVDGLHQRAGSRRVIDLHGRLDRVQCLNCGMGLARADLQQELAALNPERSARIVASAPDGDVQLDEADFSRFRVPTCHQCGGILKPAVTFFGESVPEARVEHAFERLGQSGALLVVGSSLMVYSGYRFCRAAKVQGKPMAAINLGRTRADSDWTLKVTRHCLPVLESLVQQIGVS